MAQLSSDDDSSIFSPLWHLAGHLGQYFDSATKWPVYWMSMVRQGIAWSSKLPDHGDDAYYKLCQTFDEEKGVKDGVWHGPMGADCVTYFSHAKVKEVLAGLGERFGTNDGNGTIERSNFLGFQKLNDIMWPEAPWKSIGLGCPQEAHAWIRPLLAKLVGPGGRWSQVFHTSPILVAMSASKS